MIAFGIRLLIFLCILSVHLQAKTPIKIGMSLALSGPVSTIGSDYLAVTQAVIQDANQNGGINGRPLELVVYDDAYTPQLAVKNTMTLIEKDQVDLLLGYVGTPTVTRVLPLLKRFEDRSMMLYFPFTGAEPQRRDPYQSFVFNLRASYLEETKALVSYFRSIGKSKIAVFYQSDAYGRNGWDGVRRALALYGETLVADASYARGSRFTDSYQSQLSVIQSAKPEVIIVVGSYEASAGFIRELRASGDPTIVANISFVGAQKVISLLSNQESLYSSNLVFSQVVPDYNLTRLPAVKAYRHLVASSESLQSPNFVGLEAYMNATLLVNMMKKVPGEFSASKLRDVFKRSSGISIGLKQSISFRESNQANLPVYLLKPGKNGFEMIERASK